jgi:hypothetical protein
MDVVDRIDYRTNGHNENNLVSGNRQRRSRYIYLNGVHQKVYIVARHSKIQCDLPTHHYIYLVYIST